MSHGHKDGILVGRQVISWSTFSTRIETSPGKDIVLACESGEINKYVPFSQVMGIRGAVDATLGGLLATYLLEPSEAVLNSIFERISGLLSGQVLPQFLAPFDVQITSWLDWTGLHGRVTVMANLLDLLLYACLAIVVVVFGTIWDGIGVMLDSFNISFGSVLLDWIWPVLIKPFLQVLLVGITGALGSVIAAISSALKAMITLYILTFLSSALTYVISQLIGAFLALFGNSWLMNTINAVLVRAIEDKITGPIARNLALALGGLSSNVDLKKAIDALGVHMMYAILISGLESIFDWFAYTYASFFTRYSIFEF
ncbi:MAG: hypothetical protein DRO73_10030 [Candidatus Thorarchaeota archaeon]|nr:MAG: hypothetical protein DRO73_10030 [Candidatus Thorarchaeota archaeon]